ncbi:nuclease-related domain-containing protein [Abyssicoccus albus]|uniref:nuclease-related domain-containing protein n=1 Tax=Abyssicoccus albus TaxID=1817405 RepID=UPI00097E1ED2|nr:nuclease-related domain-containing protein [Abyssicoccus albus]AQL56528.1 hypothetical protein BVH56_06145 [Abyssicoccus albus]
MNINMNDFDMIHWIMFGLALLLLILLIFFIVKMIKANKQYKELQQARDDREKKLTSDYEKRIETERVDGKKKFSEQQSKYDAIVDDQSSQISSLKQFTYGKSQYLTDITLLSFRDKLIDQERIRPEDMHVLANVLIPSKNYKQTKQVDHVILTRTGIYIVDSNYFSGHVYHGMNEQQFDQFPFLEGVYDALGYDHKDEYSFIVEPKDNGEVVMHPLDHQIQDLKVTAEKIRNILKLQYPVKTIMFYNEQETKRNVSINYSTDKDVIVLMGKPELEEYFEKHVFHGRFEYTVEELEQIKQQLLEMNP